MKKPFKHQVTRLPKILTCQRDFYQVDTFMAMVEKGEVDVAVSGDELNGLIVMKSFDKVSYSVVDNLEPWCDFFSQVAIATNTPYDDKPMRQFITKLKVDMPLTLKHVQQVKDIINQQRKLYMKAPGNVIDKIQARIMDQLAQEAAA